MTGWQWSHFLSMILAIVDHWLSTMIDPINDPMLLKIMMGKPHMDSSSLCYSFFVAEEEEHASIVITDSF